jgi:hypothetical protein
MQFKTMDITNAETGQVQEKVAEETNSAGNNLILSAGLPKVPQK